MTPLRKIGICFGLGLILGGIARVIDLPIPFVLGIGAVLMAVIICLPERDQEG